MNQAPLTTLVCFAVKEEHRHFRPAAPDCVRIVVTGMGPAAAESNLRRILDEPRSARPALVLTCGFAGGLNPAWRTGALLFETDDSALAARLRGAGAVSARFHCSNRVAVTRDEKSALRRETGADAVEMESGPIRRLCRERAIPAATLRVISDSAEEDLPLDFNALISPEGRLRLGRLVGQVLVNPGRIPALIALQRTTARAAQALGGCLQRLELGSR